ncbi:MAG: esterase-like activity of phytase family protein, partial [Rhodobacteraceae bacterium]|nr:esterase-like activity of phytase family protein [Paracoccaceae bacterium]
MRIFYGLFILIFCASAAISGPVFVQDSVTVLRDRDVAFGGFSGLHVTSNGAQFVAISDRGSLQIGDFHRENGRITDIILGELLPILDTKGQPLDRRNTDAEGLAVDANGQLYISFESNNRVMRHETPTSAAVFLPKHPDFQSLQNNSGLEALAIDANNVIYAIPERSGALDRPFPVYR